VKCALCGKTSVQIKIDLFPFSPEARKMLQKQFGTDADEALASQGVCRECLDLQEIWGAILRTNRNIGVN